MTSTNTPTRQLVPSGVVRRSEGQVWLSRDERDVLRFPVPDALRLAVVESFVFEPDVDGAFQRFAARRVATAAEGLCAVDGMLDASVHARCRLGTGALSVVLPHKRKVNVTELSRDTSGVLEAICGSALGGTNGTTATSRAMFDGVVAELVNASVLSPRPGCVEFGDFKRFWPFSHQFGFDRGGPVDRYYLKKFVQAIHPKVRGRCLEIGGSLGNNRSYQFAVDEFRTLDLPAVGDDLVGDAADPQLFDQGSWDSIVAFHVLEHCPDPFAVVSNLHRWLTPHGHAFVVVPCAQRVHNFPGDYWRFMPDGLRVLFKSFSEVIVSAYGNPLTLVSNYLGLSHKELVAEDMDFVHPDYPVLGCVVARK